MKRDIKINMGVLESIYYVIRRYADALSEIESASTKFLEVIQSQDSVAYERLAQMWETNISKEEGELKERLTSVADILERYGNEMKEYIAPVDYFKTMRVDRDDIWFNYTQIVSNSQDVMDIITDTKSTYSLVRLKEEEKERRRANYEKLAQFRTLCSSKVFGSVMDEVNAIQAIYQNRIIPFEDTDDDYKTELNSLYEEWRSFWDACIDIKRTCDDIERGMEDATVDLLAGYISIYDRSIKLCSWLSGTSLEIIGLDVVSESHDEYAINEIKGMIGLLTNPGNALEAMGQGTFDKADEEGVAYSVSYMATDLTIGFLLDKALGKALKAEDALDVAKYSDDVVDAAQGVDEVVGAGKYVDDVIESGTTTKPNQVHHYATNKSKTYTPQLEEIANRYGLDLDDAWNIIVVIHCKFFS